MKKLALVLALCPSVAMSKGGIISKAAKRGLTGGGIVGGLLGTTTAGIAAALGKPTLPEHYFFGGAVGAAVGIAVADAIITHAEKKEIERREKQHEEQYKHLFNKLPKSK